MKVVVKAYSVFKDILGETLELQIESPFTIKELLKTLRDKYKLPEDLEMFIVVNDEIVDEDYVVDRDATIHIAPSFSGGNIRLIDTRILREDEKIDFNQLFEKLIELDPESGALSVFVGFVKKRVENCEVYELEYTAIENTALKQLKKIASEEAERHDLKAVMVWHYVGKRKPGDITVVVATIARTRSSAIDATRSILERVKREVPVFKLEKRSDGEYWIIGDGRRYLRARQ